MQLEGVIEPSESPWASPVVLVRKRDGSSRFCVHAFVFITHQGLYKFKVMPFGVMNAPAVFQRLMQKVLARLMTGPKDFVAVYLDDVIVFSQSLQAHLEHLTKVFACLREMNLKLNPKKCEFMSEEVEYLGHIVTPQGLKPNQRNLDAVKEFPIPTNLKQLRQFLGLTSHYRRFVLCYAKIAQPLYDLTRQGTPFNWTASCEQAFDILKSKLLTAPILAYPDFTRDFVLETDASKRGLGAILSQLQDGSKLHPLAYASCSLSPSEKNYAITELETLAVVWAISHSDIICMATK